MMLDEKDFQFEIRKLLISKNTDELEIIFKQCRLELESRFERDKFVNEVLK